MNETTIAPKTTTNTVPIPLDDLEMIVTCVSDAVGMINEALNNQFKEGKEKFPFLIDKAAEYHKLNLMALQSRLRKAIQSVQKP